MDAGDTIQGSAAAAWTEGKAVVAPINALKLDLGIPGNWEVVYGAKALEERAGEFRHPLIAANLRDAKSKRLMFPPSLVKEVGGGTDRGDRLHGPGRAPAAAPQLQRRGSPSTSPTCSRR